MQLLPTLSNFRPAPSLSDATTLKQRLTDTVEDIVNFVPQMQSLIATQNILSGEIQTAANLVEKSKNATAVSELNAQAAANFKGIWASSRIINGVTLNGYSVGESVRGSDNVFYACIVTHTTAQNPTSTTGYWVVNVPLGSIGNLRTPLVSFLLKNKLPSDITISRISPINYINRYRMMKSASANTPAFKTGGLLCEPLATNLLLYSQDITNAAWLYNAVDYTVIGNTTETADPYGTNLADKINVNSGKSSFVTGVPRQTIAKSAVATQYTQTYKLKPYGMCTSVRFVHYGVDSNSNASAVVSLIDGSVIGTPYFSGGFSAVTVNPSKVLADGWFEVSITFTTDTYTSITVRAFPYVGLNSFISDGNSGFYMIDPQLETGAASTTAIVTTSSPLTRSVHSTSFVTDENIPSLKDAWSFVIDFTLLSTIVNTHSYVLSAWSSSYEYFTVSTYNNFLYVRLVVNGVMYFGLSTNTLVVSQEYRISATFNGSTLKIYINGMLDSVTSLSVLPRNPILPANTQIGSLSPVSGHSHILVKRIELFDKELTPTEVAID